MNAKVLLFLAVTAVSVLLQNSSAAACTAPSFNAAERQPIPTRNIDQTVLSKAVAKQTNYYRCKRGLRPLDHDPALKSAAHQHSRNMARLNELSHDLPVSGQRTMGQRFDQSNVRVKRVRAENIGTEYRLIFGTGVFIIHDAKSCNFSYRSTRERIPQHSYGSLAAAVVKRWYESPSHRKNMLNREITRIGAGARFTPEGIAPCGTYFVTQNFAG